MATPKTNYDNALAYEDGLVKELDNINTNLLPSKEAALSSELTWLASVTSKTFCDGRGGTRTIYNTPAVLAQVQIAQDAVKPCNKQVLWWRTRLDGWDLTAMYNSRNSKATSLANEINVLKARKKELVEIDIPAAEFARQQAYQAWQKWKYDQLTPEEQQELNQVASDAEYLEILNQGRKYAIYVAIAVAAIVILWIFYKFVIKKGA